MQSGIAEVLVLWPPKQNYEHWDCSASVCRWLSPLMPCGLWPGFCRIHSDARGEGDSAWMCGRCQEAVEVVAGDRPKLGEKESSRGQLRSGSLQLHR